MTVRRFHWLLGALLLVACSGADDGREEKRGSAKEALDDRSCIPLQCYADCLASVCGNDICGGASMMVCASRCGCSIGYAEVAESQ
jgi:hypothetical protein